MFVVKQNENKTILFILKHDIPIGKTCFFLFLRTAFFFVKWLKKSNPDDSNIIVINICIMIFEAFTVYKYQI